MPRKKNVLPSYRLHQASGQVRVRIDGRDVYLGKFDSPESKAQYSRLLAEHFGESGPTTQLRRPTEQAAPLTISELIVEYDDYAKS